MKDYSTTAISTDFNAFLDKHFIEGQRNNVLPAICRRAIEQGMNEAKLYMVLSSYSKKHGHSDLISMADIEHAYNTALETNAPRKATATIFSANDDAVEALLEESDPGCFAPTVSTDRGDEVTIEFLKALFAADDVVYIGDAKHNDECNFRTVAEWSKKEKGKYRLPATRDYLGINSFQPGLFSHADANVTSFRYFLLEADPSDEVEPLDAADILADEEDPRYEQLKLLAGLISKGLPIVSVTFSGNKSFHALVAVKGIETKEEWDRDVKGTIFAHLKALGFDPAVSNPSRMSRLPGYSRLVGGKLIYQDLVYFRPSTEPLPAKAIVDILSSMTVATEVAAKTRAVDPEATPFLSEFMDDKTQHATDDLVAEMLADMGVTFRRNSLDQALLIEGEQGLLRKPLVKKGHKLPTTIVGLIRKNLKAWVGPGRAISSHDAADAAYDWLESVEEYNPILDGLSKVTWDGHDYLADIYRLMGIEHDEFSMYFMRTWFLSAFYMLDNDGDRTAELVPVLYSKKQGVGKSTLIANICPDKAWCGSASINPESKDSLMKATRKWITELREIGTTTKHDVDALKGFLTSSTDTYRPPYGRDPIDFPRRAVYIGTTNEKEFMVDNENRRFVTIPMQGAVRNGRKDPAIMREIRGFREHAWQLWAQVAQVFAEEGPDACCIDDLKVINGVMVGDYQITSNNTAVKLLPFEDILKDIYDFNAPRENWKFRRTSRVIKDLEATHRVSDSRALGKTLKAVCTKIGSEIKEDDSNGNRYMLPPLREGENERPAGWDTFKPDISTINSRRNNQ